jgi:hypothetical protein
MSSCSAFGNVGCSGSRSFSYSALYSFTKSACFAEVSALKHARHTPASSFLNDAGTSAVVAVGYL